MIRNREGFGGPFGLNQNNRLAVQAGHVTRRLGELHFDQPQRVREITRLRLACWPDFRRRKTRITRC